MVYLSYDLADRLIGISNTAGSTYTYSFNHNDQIIQTTSTDGTDNLSYAGDNQLLASTLNRLTGIKTTPTNGQGTPTTATSESFVYDDEDRRISQSVTGQATQYTIYDGSTPILMFTSTGAVTHWLFADPVAEGGLSVMADE